MKIVGKYQHCYVKMYRSTIYKIFIRTKYLTQKKHNIWKKHKFIFVPLRKHEKHFSKTMGKYLELF